MKKYIRGIIISAIALSVMVVSKPAFSSDTLLIRRHNNFLYSTNFHPALNKNNLVILHYVIGSGIQFVDGSNPGSSINPFDETGIVPALTLPALFYPNPFRLEEGAIVGYRLSRSDMDISFRMYDMRGNEIFRKDMIAGSPGAQIGYNKVPFNRSVLGHGNLPAGIYFYILMHDNKVLGKGKVAVKP